MSGADPVARKNPDVVLHLNGHRVVIPAEIDPVRQALLGDLDEVDCEQTFSNENHHGAAPAVDDDASPSPSAGGGTDGINRRRSQTPPGPGNRPFNDAGADAHGAPSAERGMASSKEGDDLSALLEKYSIVRIGKQVVVGFWKEEQIPGGGRHPILQFMTLDAFDKFHADKVHYVSNDKGSHRVSVTRAFLEEAKRFDGVIYAPGEGSIVRDEMNMWQGFGIAPKRGKWTLIRHHIERVLAGGDQEQATYIIKWIAWAFQNPGRAAETVLVFRGGKGSGKGIFIRGLCRIFGSHGLQISNPEHLVGKHNRHLQHCSFLFADEAFWAGDKKSEGALKRIITEPTLSIEPKGIDMFSVANCLHIVMAGNQEWIVPASHDERRFAVMDVSDSHIRDIEYFERLNEEMEQGGLAAMLYDLLRLPLQGWHPRKDIPQTKSLQKQKALSITGVDALIEHLCHEGRLPGARRETPNRTITDGVERGSGLIYYAKRNVRGLQHDSVRMIKSALRDEWGCKNCKVGTMRAMEFLPLDELRVAFERKYGPQEWAHADVTDWEVGTVAENPLCGGGSEAPKAREAGAT